MAKTKKSQKKPVSQVRKSALRKPSSKVSSDTKLLVPKSNSQKVEDANLLQAEVFERAKSANALATSSVKEKKDKKGNKEKSKKEKKDHKEVEATEEKDKKQQKKLKDKKDKEKKSKDKTTDQKPLEKRTKGESATDQRSKDEKSADKKKGEKKEGKERKKPGDSTKATKAGNKSKENAEALEAAEKTKEKEEKERALALELKKASVPGPAPTTPPAKRLRMKSPTESTASGSSSIHTDATSTRYQSTKDMAEAHFAKLRLGLSAAVKEAEENAHLDCGTEDEAASDPSSSEDDGEEEGRKAEEKSKENEDQKAKDEAKDEALQIAIANTTRNSNLYERKTNKREWDRFDRQTKGGQFPTGLQPLLRKKKTDLFGLWLDFGEDWDRVQCEVERRAESTNLARSEWVAVQAKTLKAGMEQSKFDELIKKRIDAGLYYQDLDFPSDPMENWIYMPKGRLLRQDELVSESVSTKATKKLDQGLFNALTAEEGGILPAGALPAVKAASEAGQRAVLSALDDDGKQVMKPKRQQKAKPGEAEKISPKTVLESGSQMIANR
ncbi:unnamed protein product [Cladocopium goreaui]|uniref:Dynein heavy chain-like protein 2 n=1 Tax=Cladocopium goreaui TaxID=2562237 RepID=A0A9P1GB91_9DINO|nr:unnamed protein product [Cladocopium goreaui]